MKRIYVNEKWCLGCHLCEYYCAFANSGESDMAVALRDVKINPRIRIEERNGVSFAVGCRHCEEPLCVKSCITGALSIHDGVIQVDQDKCVHCKGCQQVCKMDIPVWEKPNSVECIRCGDCKTFCPTGAIHSTLEQLRVKPYGGIEAEKGGENK